MTDIKQGWGWPMLSRKPHWFVNGTSICGKWMFTGEIQSGSPTPGKDDCRACVKKLTKHLSLTKGLEKK